MLLHIHFADLLGSQFIALNPLAPQQLLLFGRISSSQLRKAGRRGDEVVVPVQIPQVDEHVQGVGQNQQQDQGHGQADQNGWREGRGAVSGLGKLPPLDGKALDLSGEKEELKRGAPSPLRVCFPVGLGDLDPSLPKLKMLCPYLLNNLST